MTIPNHTRELLIRLASHMAYMQGQLEARHELDDPEDYYWYRESVALRQKVTDALADEPAVSEGREPAAVMGEPTDAELESFLLDVAAEHGDIYWAEPLVLARAVLARYGQQPAPLVEPEPEFPTTQELKTFACEWWRTFGLVKNKATCTWVLDQVDPEHFADFSRDLLARWGHQSAPPAEGEVAELVAWLLEEAVQAANSDAPRSAGMLTWAAQVLGEHADLLEQRHPASVPVSERLPGPEDCDAEGRCWWGEPQIGDSHDATWNLCTQDEAEDYCTWGTKCGWLPFTALPLPAFWDGDCDKTATSANQ